MLRILQFLIFHQKSCIDCGDDNGLVDLSPIKQKLSALEQEINEIKKGGSSGISSGTTTTSSAYDFAIFGLSLGAAGCYLGNSCNDKKKIKKRFLNSWNYSRFCSYCNNTYY